MAYHVEIRKSAIKKLSKINEPYYSNIKNDILNLSENPRPPGCKKLKGRNGFRIRVANYRVIYEVIDHKLIVDVFEIGHRKDIYK